ncbi:hypothetical protein [uncultured Roseobacter sp.]|uniref:hypothetical protein n=1 Tax=uncultured Roseobacter sp. TaxID=114847 RepID=UPI002634E670|nr:hypothetical protein [uncultured Roseobacter sp.]
MKIKKNATSAIESPRYEKTSAPEEQKFIVVVVSKNGRDICKRLEKSSKELFVNHLIEFRPDRSTHSPSVVSPSETFLLALDSQELSFMEADLKEQNAQVYGFKMRYSNRVPVISFGPQISARQHRNLLLKAGFDFYIPGDYDANTVLQMYSIFEKNRFSKKERKYHFSGKHERNLKLGRWTLIVENQSVKTPSNVEVSLTKIEWDYLFFLIDRDIVKSEIPENTRVQYEEKVNAKAIVYKIKKKLGGDFPIKKKKLGPYHLDATHT